MAPANKKPAQQKPGKQKTGQQKQQKAGSAGGGTTGNDKGGANRRRFDRRDTHIVAQLSYNDMPVDGVVTNLSLEGCLFSPRIDIPVGERVKLKLAGENKAVPATVKAVSDLGVHCLLHAGGATLGRLSVEVDDMALLMLNASRPHVVEPATVAAKPAKKKIVKKAAAAPAQKNAAKKAAKKKVKKAAKTAAPARKKPTPKKKAIAKKKPAAKKKATPKKRR